MISTSQQMVKLEEISAVYKLPRERVHSFKEFSIRLASRKQTYQDHIALSNITLQVQRGEVFGIIGRNGAGKSTLLKVVSRILPPSSGRVRVYGTVAPLLTLGAGFHPELTGRENIYLNGAILRLSEKEIETQVEKIIEFSGLNEFIDNPLRTYSSGMTARLGFSVATSLDSEILVIDEILSVGDEEFREKSYARILEHKKRGATILLVTHNLSVIEKLCDRVLWLEESKTKMLDVPTEVIPHYREQFQRNS